MNFTSENKTVPNPNEASFPAETILVVDDQPVLCKVAALFLQHCGYRVLMANDAEQAKKMARENADIDLVLADVEMPVMKGDELAEWFHVTRPNVAVVFMSGNPMHRCRLNPCYFIEKPFVHLGTLLKTLREALNHRSAGYQIASIAA